MPWKRYTIVSGIAATSLLAVFFLDHTAPFGYVHARNLLRDAIARSGRTAPPNPDLVFLAINSASVGIKADAEDETLIGSTAGDPVATRALHLMERSWPWPREVYALVVERLIEAGAKAVVFDLTFPTATEGDGPFHDALERYRERVVIGSNFVSTTDNNSSVAIPGLTRPADSLVPEAKPIDSRVGYTNFWPDEDEVVRSAQFRVAGAQVDDRLVLPDEEIFLSLSAAGLKKAGLNDRIPAGLGSHRIRYTAPPRKGFPPRSLFEIFAPRYWTGNYQSGEFFRGKIVLVGAEGNWQHDDLPTPFGSMPGPELHLNAMNAAIHGEFVDEMSHGTVMWVTTGAGVLGILLTLGIRSPWLRLLALIGAAVVYVWAALLAFNHLSLYIPFLPGLLELNVTVLLGLVCDFTWERFEKTRVRRTLERYVSSNVVQELLDNPRLFQQALGGVMKPVAVLFTDLRGFSSFSARTDPQKLVGQLNEYLGAMVGCVFRHGGTLDKFVGDAVMAVWGNVKSEGIRNDTTNAVRAALQMRSELERLNRGWRERGLPELRAGMAVNQGEVVVGNIGSPQRMEFTVIGDVVNICWKLQELTKDLGADLIVTKNVAALLVEHFDLQPLGRVEVRGLSEPQDVCAVHGAIELPVAGAPVT
ncbi:MAG: adenylate/guanylate cyclase domain-containing protein [Chthoniobacterales bacterium]